MNLTHALDLAPGDVVSFVGAGGKTSTMFRLAGELAAQGWRVISTTTTRITQNEMRLAPQQVGFGHGMQLPETLPEQVEQYRHIFVFSKTEADGKVRGVRQAWLDGHLARAPYLDALLVEADGSRRLPMKAPLAHEPAIPTSSTVVVPVIGLDALGLPLDEKHIYGAEIIHNATGHPIGHPVTTRLMAAVLISPQLGLKSVPRQARVALLLNQVTPTSLPQAYEIAAFALTDQNVERVLIGAVQEAEPIREIKRRVGAIVLAAGASRRMGQPKLLLPWGQSTIIRSVCERVVASGLHEVIVIAGEEMEPIQQQLVDLPVQVVYNPDHAEGEMLSSLKLGLQSIWHSSSGCMVVLGDQPEIGQDILSLVMNAYSTGLGRIIVPTYRGQWGHPVLIDNVFWPSIIDLPLGRAPRDMLSTHEQHIYRLEVDTESVLSDIDTPEDYKRARPQSGPVSAG